MGGSDPTAHTCFKEFLMIGDSLLGLFSIDMGIDLLNPVQADAKGMEPDMLKREFGDRLSMEVNAAVLAFRAAVEAEAWPGVAETATYVAKPFPWATFVPDHGLASGERVIGPRFPLVWTRGADLPA